MNKNEQLYDSFSRLVDDTLRRGIKHIEEFKGCNGDEILNEMTNKIKEALEMSEKLNAESFYSVKNDERVLDFFKHIGRMDLWEESSENDYQIDDGDILYNDPLRETGVTAELNGLVVIFENI